MFLKWLFIKWSLIRDKFVTINDETNEIDAVKIVLIKKVVLTILIIWILRLHFKIRRNLVRFRKVFYRTIGFDDIFYIRNVSSGFYDRVYKNCTVEKLNIKF